ncbi:Hypothetical_protein [Hexamita inflata]|nr:Hypothetical protein HINF_LOCUS14852 [Hexamita inflata]
MNQLQSLLKLQLQKQLQTEPELITYNVMMLSDKAYKICFVNASLELNMSVNTLQKTFQEVAMQELVSQEPLSLNQKIIQLDYYRQNHRISKRFTDFQILFEKSIQKVLLRYGIDECESSQEVCRQVNMFLQFTNKRSFWNQVQQLIPEKSDKQLREYYQKSFQRLMHESLTDEDDKQLLKQLFINGTDKRAAVLADEFMQVCKHKNYFKRNIVMYIVNLKRK